MKKTRRHRNGTLRLAPPAAAAPPADAGHITVPALRASAGYANGPLPDSGTRWLGGGGVAYKNASPGLFGRPGQLTFGAAQSGNQEVVRERRQAVINSRIVDRNNALMHSGITKRATNLVGTNLKLRAMPNWRALQHPTCDAVWAAEFAEAYENLFSLWADDARCLCDAERHLQFGGMMHMAARNTYGADGETLLHIRASEERRQRYGGKFRTFLEVVDPDRISNPQRPTPMQNGRFLSEGRVLDEWGAAIGFWVETRHPSDAIGAREWVLVPRETSWGRPVGVHWFPKHRSGVQRAMPAILQSLRDVKMLDKFDDHTLKAAALGAFMSMYVKSESASSEVLKRLMTAAPTGDKNELEALWDMKFGLYDDLNLVAEGQQLPVLPPGDEIMTNIANRAADNTDSFHYIFERKMAQNLQLGTANFTGDYSKTSFASIRADFMDAWRDTLAVRHQFTQHTAAPVNFALMEECLSRGMLPLPRGAPDFYENATAYTQSEFRGPAMGTIDPVKDPTGAGISIQGGFSTPQAAAAERGGDLYENIDEIADATAYALRKGVTLQWGQAKGGDASAAAEDAPEDPNETTPAPKPKPAPAQNGA